MTQFFFIWRRNPFVRAACDRCYVHYVSRVSDDWQLDFFLLLVSRVLMPVFVCACVDFDKQIRFAQRIRR